MALAMPPCFDCDKELEKGNVWIVSNDIMKTKPNYDYRLSETDPEFFLKNQEISDGLITVCKNCDMKRFQNELETLKL